MGKVRDDVSESRASKPADKSGARRGKNQFFATLFSSALYKPMQGWYARLWTGIAMAAVLLLGVSRLFATLDGMPIYTRFGICGALAAGFAWLSFRLVHYPPFADFLIATQAEMNKVSWISREDLRRATGVVLVTVLVISFYLFAIDNVWMVLLQQIGVLDVSAGPGQAIGSAG